MSARPDIGAGPQRGLHPIRVVASGAKENHGKPKLPAREESSQYLDGGENQVRQMRLRSDVGPLLRVSLSALYETR